MVKKRYNAILKKMRTAYRQGGLGGGHPSASSQCPRAPKPGRDGEDVLTASECVLAVVIKLMPDLLKEASTALERNLSSCIFSQDIEIIRTSLVASNVAADKYVGTHPRMEEFLTHGGMHWRIDEFWRLFEDMSEAPIPLNIQNAIQEQLDDTVANGRDAKQEEWHDMYSAAKYAAQEKLSSEEYRDQQAVRAALQYEKAKAQKEAKAQEEAKAEEELQPEAQEGAKYGSPSPKKRTADEDPNLARADSWGSAASTDSGQDGIELSPDELMRRARILNVKNVRKKKRKLLRDELLRDEYNDLSYLGNLHSPR